ncbi:MAG TPA: dipeptidase [Gemmatimonadaceae bacterium]|nr:dipeptidase [Gemmatimonadaceae bacterium]
MIPLPPKPVRRHAPAAIVALALALALACTACGRPESSHMPSSAVTVPPVSARAAKVYRNAVVIDTHNDLPSRMLDDGYDADVRHQPGYGKTKGDTDLPRLVESGITAQFLSAFIDAKYPLVKPGQSWVRVEAYMDTIHAFVDRHPDSLIFATNSDDVRRAKKEGKVAIFIGVEGGHAIENSLDKLRQLYAQGARYMTLTWNNGNDWAGSSIGVNGTSTAGLTDFGKDVVREMNRLGMLVDISHVSDSTFYDVIATSKDPVIASHSSSRALGGHPRNMTDDMLRAVARNDGVVDVNFNAPFIDPTFAAAEDSVRKTTAAEAEAAMRQPGADTAKLRSAYDSLTNQRIHALPRPPLSVLLDHIDHIVQVAGVDHVGLGSDFDGVDGLLPADMLDVTYLPNIAQGLIDRGYTDTDITKILGGNMLRVIEIVLDRQPSGKP